MPDLFPSPSVYFFVPGIPAPGGSKRFVGFGKKTGRAILIDAAGERNKNWRSIVADCGMQAMRLHSMPLFVGPLEVKFEFVVRRPKGHLRANATVKDSAPQWPTTKPDALKLTRSTEDALTGVVWHDDAQTVKLDIQKRFAAYSEACGCHITIKALA